MVSHFQEQQSLLQNSIFDVLYCDEERFDEESSCGFGLKEPDIADFNEIHEKPSIFVFEHDLFWEEEELESLLSKEKSQSCSIYDEINSDGSLKMVRDEAIKWMLKVSAYYGFTARTSVLAVNYFHRFIISPCFLKDNPWMSQLAAVSCISIAAKVEEIQVPLIIDLQVEESQYLFEAKTIKRMELVVLSTLQWKMNPVTPISYIDHIVRRFGLIICLQWEFLGRCENLILSIIADCRLVCYLPSVVAAATMLFAITEIESCKASEFQKQFMSIFKTNKEKIEECHELIMEIMKDHSCNFGLKRKHRSIPSSPSGVADAYFSSDCSNDSWVISSSPQPLSKRSRVQEQHMRLAPLSSVCWRG